MQRRPSPVVLADTIPSTALAPASLGLLRDVVLVLGSAAAMGVLAQLSLPFVPVPITGQTLGVLLLGAVLGGRRGALAMLAYLGEGLVGLPVFANGASAWTPSSAGMPTILGPTAGYLASFPLAAYVVGALAERGWDRRVWSAGAAMVVGQAIIYVLGAAWLAQFVGPDRAIAAGIVPFLVGDALKLVVATVLLPSGWHVIRLVQGVR